MMIETLRALVLLCSASLPHYECNPLTADAVAFGALVGDVESCLTDALSFTPDPPPGFYVWIVCGPIEVLMTTGDGDV